MGNRAIITGAFYGQGIYLHWNGGKDSIEGFLAYAKMKNYDNIYDLYTVIKPFLQSSCEIIQTNRNDDIGDNGIYLVDFLKMRIIGRKFQPYSEQNEYDLLDFMEHIDEHQPEHMKLKKYIRATEIKSYDDVKVGDKVCTIDSIYNDYREYEVVGFGENTVCNGTNVHNMPMINQCINSYGNVMEDNINNYIKINEHFSQKYRKIIN